MHCMIAASREMSDEPHFITLSSGSARDNISQDTIKNTILPILTQDVLTKYSDVTKPIIEEMIENQKGLENLIKLRDGLLPLLMNGQASLNYHLAQRVINFFCISEVFIYDF